MTPGLGSPTRGSIKGTIARLGRPLTSSSRVHRDDPRGLTARYRLGELAYLLGDLPPRGGRSRSSPRRRSTTRPGNGVDLPGRHLFRPPGLSPRPGGLPAVARGLSQGRLADRAKYGLGRTLAALGERDRAITRSARAGQASEARMGRQGLAADRFDPEVGRAVRRGRRSVHHARACRASQCARPEAQLQRALALVGSSGPARPNRSCEAWRRRVRARRARGPLWSWRRSSSSSNQPTRP